MSGMGVECAALAQAGGRTQSSQRMHEAMGTSTGVRCGVIAPLAASSLKTTTLLAGMLAHRSHLPSGVTSRFWGPLPPLGWMASRVLVPSAAILFIYRL